MVGPSAHEASSFGFLAPSGPLYLRLATVAERALAVEIRLTLASLRQLAEAFANHAAVRAGLIGRAATKRRMRRRPADVTESSEG